MIDDEVSSVGSANMDFRSFELNFEINAFGTTKKLLTIASCFRRDVKKSKLLTKEKYEQRPLSIKFRDLLS